MGVVSGANKATWAPWITLGWGFQLLSLPCKWGDPFRRQSETEQTQRGSDQPESFSVSRLLRDTTEEIKGERLLEVNRRNSKPSFLQDNNKTFKCPKEVSWEVELSVTSASLWSWFRTHQIMNISDLWLNETPPGGCANVIMSSDRHHRPNLSLQPLETELTSEDQTLIYSSV